MTAKTKSRTLDLVYMATFAGIIAVCSWISIAFLDIVPFTLQTFAVFLALSLLGGRRAFGALVVYVLRGAVGVPVFSGFNSGVAILLGPTGGYITGFLLMALLFWGATTLFGHRLPVEIGAMAAGLLVCYAAGTAQFLLVMQSGGNPYTLGAALSMCVLPFLPIDAVKMAAAILLGRRLRRLLPV